MIFPNLTIHLWLQNWKSREDSELIFACGNVGLRAAYLFDSNTIRKLKKIQAIRPPSKNFKKHPLWKTRVRIQRSCMVKNLVRHILTIMTSVQKTFPSSPLFPIFAVPLPPFPLRKCVPQVSTIQQLPYQSLQLVHTCIDEHQSREEETIRESTHPNMAPIPFGRHPNTCGYGPKGNPDRSFTSACPAALPEIGWPSA